jgi:uncharacterized lipoprotein YmbA
MNYSSISVVAVLALTACSPFKPVKDSAVRHLLEPLVPQRALTSATPAIAINRPSIPSYLDRMQLVTRKEGQLVRSRLHLWAESLDVAIERVLASNLSRLTGSMNIQPVESFTTLDYDQLLEVKITQFEPETANQMVLQGTWKLQAVSGKETRSHFFRIIVPIPSIKPAMNARVTSMNEALVDLSQQIARQR